MDDDFAKVAQAVGRVLGSGLGRAEEKLRDSAAEPRLAHGLDGGDRLHQGLRRIAGLEMTMKRVVTRSGPARANPSVRAFRLVGARAWAIAPAIAFVAGNTRRQLGECLAAKARAAGAEKDERSCVLGERR